jgi:hypothetical protein
MIPRESLRNLRFAGCSMGGADLFAIAGVARWSLAPANSRLAPWK